jgi:phage antirepressor YoqD-like protein
MQQAACMLNLKNFGRTKLMALLRDNGMLTQDNLPRVTYVEAGHLAFYNKDVPDRYGKLKIVHVPVISDSGIELVKNLIKNNNE